MKKKLFLSWLLLLFLFFSVLPASSHPGGTDSDGGHHDSATGEYHWHHGHGAHQHEDLDGDGYPEYCPFDDKGTTEHSLVLPTTAPTVDDPSPTGSGVGGNGGHSNSSYTTEPSTAPSEAETKSTEPVVVSNDDTASGESSFPYVVGAILFLLGIPLFIAYAIKSYSKDENDRKNDDRKEVQERYLQKQAEEFVMQQHEADIAKRIKQAECCAEEQFEAAQQATYALDKENLEILLGGDRADIFIGLRPEDSIIGSDGLPRTIESGDEKLYWGDKYTFYVSTGEKRYHTRYCRYASSTAVHASKIKSYCQPCAICRPKIPDMKWVKEYKKKKEALTYIKNRYGIS